ncbi:MAG: CBS domain-containing protein [Candidatus Caldarchaeum sp.]|uniref:CBS domain-containing protein n=1 Tax=Caldiarchaeum subterraneum TaxID=311458 RepID=A0A7C5QMC4_CALS0
MSEVKMVREIMTEDVVTVSSEDSVYNAARLMADMGVGSCVVIKNEKPVGIVTERDVVRKVVAAGLSPKRTTVEKVMSSPLIVVGENTSVAEAAAIMAKHRVRRLVVVRDEHLAGVVSVTDLVRVAGEVGFKTIIPALLRG